MRVTTRGHDNGPVRVVVNTRDVHVQTHEVVDLHREGRSTLVVCVRCFATWEEGSDAVPINCL
jgi:hypothetical protein